MTQKKKLNSIDLTCKGPDIFLKPGGQNKGGGTKQPRVGRCLRKLYYGHRFTITPGFSCQDRETSGSGKPFFTVAR